MLSKRLADRETSGGFSGQQNFKRHCAQQRFSRFRAYAHHDTHDPDSANLQLSFLRRRSKVVEIVSAGEIVFALTLSGVCAAFRGKRRICFLNITPDEVVRSLFYNKASQSIITVSVYRKDNFSCLKCRSTQIEYIRRGKTEAGIPLFESECLRWPGFVEFDEVNSKVLTFSVPDHSYKVWSMHNYELLYTLSGSDVTEIKISPGIMLLIHARQGGYVPLKIISIADGTELKSFNHLLQRSKKVDFIEQFNEKLLVKQEGENLNIVDVHTGSVTSVSKTDFVTPSAFIFLYENNLFLTFRQRTVTVWNFRGEQVTAFEDHTLWHPETSTNNIFITAAQDYIISFCRPTKSQKQQQQQRDVGGGGGEEDVAAERGIRPRGEVHISHILTGKCVARLSGDSSSSDEAAAAADENDEVGGSSQDTTVSAATQAQFGSAEDSEAEDGLTMRAANGREPGSGFGEVTALHFSEERNELYVGDKMGVVHVYSQ